MVREGVSRASEKQLSIIVLYRLSIEFTWLKYIFSEWKRNDRSTGVETEMAGAFGGLEHIIRSVSALECCSGRSLHTEVPT